MKNWDVYHQERRDRAVSELASCFGVEGHITPRGSIVISRSDADGLMSSVPMKRDNDWLNQGNQLWGITLEIAPDWTFNPASVAWARFLATWIVLLRLRQIVVWMNRKLTR